MPGAPEIIVVGAGINGLVAANTLVRAGARVAMIERADTVGGACVAASAEVDGLRQDYALGASVLGLMQDFVFRDTGLAERLRTHVPSTPKQVYFPGLAEPLQIHRDPRALDREFARRLGETGDAAAFRADEARVVAYLQAGYRAATPPSLAEARAAIGPALTRLWITGSARHLLQHYFSSEGARAYMAMTATESGPVQLSEPGTAFTIPLMDSGSVFGGHYGFVRGGIWQVTAELGRINRELGVTLHTGASVEDVDTGARKLRFVINGHERSARYDHLLLATDPVTAARLVGDAGLQDLAGRQRKQGSAGKLNLLFRRPVRWKQGPPGADRAFRFRFLRDSLDGFEAAAAEARQGADFSPGYLQIYPEGAAMRHMGLEEPFDRLAVFFNFMGLGETGDDLPGVRREVEAAVLDLVENPDDLAWSRLLSPRDLQLRFLFPGGNLDHTMLVGGQTHHERRYSAPGAGDFYRFGRHANVHLCGAAAYPCGSVAGTPGFMCAAGLLRRLGLSPCRAT